MKRHKVTRDNLSSNRAGAKRNDIHLVFWYCSSSWPLASSPTGDDEHHAHVQQEKRRLPHMFTVKFVLATKIHMSLQITCINFYPFDFFETRTR